MKFNEDTRVKIPATVQFLRLGYSYQSLKDAEIDTETRIFINRFKPSMEKINNRKFSESEILSLISEINNVIKNNDLGKEFYQWLINPFDRVKLIDFKNIENNDFAVVNELFFGEQETGSFRPDINILVNGIPLAFLEVKRPNNDGGIQAEFRRMIHDRLDKNEHKKYFNMLQCVTFSNNMEYEDDDDTVAAEDIKAGSFYTTPNGKLTSFSFFREEQPKIDGFKDISIDKIKYVLKDNGYSPIEADTPEFSENNDIHTPCNSFVSSFFEMERLMYFIQYGLMYVDEAIPQKHIMRYPQFFATRQIIRNLKDGNNRGIIWHTQGSGKTGLAAFSNRIIRDYYANTGITTRFFFVVDRLDLLTQASLEFTNRGLHVINCQNRREFQIELNKTLSTNTSMDSDGEITVVNIHKFTDEMPVARNDYNAKVQRIFFIDEAHRSYSSKGEFFKNLMLVDDDAVFVALTGTPLLSKKERSNLKFGDYIHKYFYDKSIADGYTLRIKKESIDTTARVEIRENLELENPDVDKKIIMESDEYIDALSKFIQKDFRHFRLQNSDNTIGGMIVCSSNNQAKKIKQWFDENSQITTGLVITDDSIPTRMNKQTQVSFKQTLEIDILIVHQMLTTGYDVKRLKKMYLLRNAREHTLLQTISRVNRPYKSPNGKVYQYGYIVDFVDIEQEYDRTIDAYLKELEDDLDENGENEGSLSGLVVGPEDINKKYLSYQLAIEQMVEIDNLESFRKQIGVFTKDRLLYLKRLLNGVKTCYTEFLLSRATKYARQINIDLNKKMLSEVQHRIDFINLKSRPTDTLSVISNEDVLEIIYEFIKMKIVIMDLSKFTEKSPENENVKKIIETVKKIQKEIKNNKNRNQSEIILLDEFLQKIFELLEISDLDDLEGINDELIDALEKVRKINQENERLAAKYDGNYSFVKTYTDCIEQYSSYDKADIEDMIMIIYECYKDVNDVNSLVLQSRDNFITSVKMNTTKQLLKTKLYKKLNLKTWYTNILGEAYTNIKMFK